MNGYAWDDWLQRLERTRVQFATLINAQPEEIAFIQNASLGLNFAAQMFDNQMEVLTISDEFPSVTLPWLQQGYPVRFIDELTNFLKHTGLHDSI